MIIRPLEYQLKSLILKHKGLVGNGQWQSIYTHVMCMQSWNIEQEPDTKDKTINVKNIPAG